MFTPRNIDVLGKVDPGFEHVKEVFKQNFDKTDEISAQLCVVKSGKIVNKAKTIFKLLPSTPNIIPTWYP